tara:strand:+ start:433 stop:810 length:378 start_codon:yes stop_codon:yes gene_type:complete
MITKEQERSILPLDMTSIIGLIESSGGTYAPLNYDVVQPSPDLTEIHLDIQQCDPDSIAIEVTPSHIHVTADVSFNFQQSFNTDDHIQLKRRISTSIPLAPGVHAGHITSEITDGIYIIRIPHMV